MIMKLKKRPGPTGASEPLKKNNKKKMKTSLIKPKAVSRFARKVKPTEHTRR
jgi:hypothetical protein